MPRRPLSAMCLQWLRAVAIAAMFLCLLEPTSLRAVGHVLYASTAIRPLVGRGGALCMSVRPRPSNFNSQGRSGVLSWFGTRAAPTWPAATSALPSNGGGLGLSGNAGNGGGGGNGTDAPSGASFDANEPDNEAWRAHPGLDSGRQSSDALPLGAFLLALQAILTALLAPLRALWSAYTTLLLERPLYTKALTAGLIAFVGDLGAQLFEHSRGLSGVGPWVSDKRRSMAVVIDGVFLTGPGLHFLYGLLEATFPTSGGKLPAAIPAALHVLFDTFVFDPMFVCSFFCMTGMLERRPLLSDVLPQLQREYWPALRGSWGVSVLFWPIQYWTFRFMPLQFRVMAVNLCDVCWTATLSFFSHKDIVPVAGTPPAPKQSEAQRARKAEARVAAEARKKHGAGAPGKAAAKGRKRALAAAMVPVAGAATR